MALASRFWHILSQPVFGPMLRRRGGCVFITLIILVIAALATVGYSPMPCPALNHLQVPCPGCGMTRSVNEAVMLDWPGVWRMHVFGPLLLLLGLLFFLGAVLPGSQRLALSGWVERIERRTAICGILLLLLWVYWVARLAGYLGGTDALFV